MSNFNWTRRHTIIAVSVAIYAVFAILLAIIINSRVIVSWINGTLSVLAPIIIGAAIAYLCAPIMKLYEDKLFMGIKGRRLKRVLSVVCTYLFLLLAITAVLLIVIPQLQRSYEDFIANLNVYTTQAISYVNRIIAQFDFSISNDQISEYISVEDIQAKISEWFKDTSTLLQQHQQLCNQLRQIACQRRAQYHTRALHLGLYTKLKGTAGAQFRMLCASVMNKEKYDSLMEWGGSPTLPSAGISKRPCSTR